MTLRSSHFSMTLLFTRHHDFIVIALHVISLQICLEDLPVIQVAGYNMNQFLVCR